MRAFGFINRTVYGTWDGKAGRKITKRGTTIAGSPFLGTGDSFLGLRNMAELPLGRFFLGD
jgi:hypothetical protein